MREIVYTAQAEDDGREVKRVIRSRMGVSHRQLGALKAAGGILIDGEPARSNAPVRAGSVIIENCAGTGVNVVATRSVDAR